MTGGSGSLELVAHRQGRGLRRVHHDGRHRLPVDGILDGAYDGRDIAFVVTQRGVELRFAGRADAADIDGTFTTDCDAMDGTWTVDRSSR